jgi:hypothetical protein
MVDSVSVPELTATTSPSGTPRSRSQVTPESASVNRSPSSEPPVVMIRGAMPSS